MSDNRKKSPVRVKRNKKVVLRSLLAVDLMSVVLLTGVVVHHAISNGTFYEKPSMASSEGQQASEAEEGQVPVASSEQQMIVPEEARVKSAVDLASEEDTFDYDAARAWLKENSNLFDENQIHKANDDNHYAQLLYRWMHDDYTVMNASEIKLTEAEQEAKIPLFEQWDDRWGYAPYGEQIIGTSGCGPTCMAMIACGLLRDPSINPQVVAEYAQNNNLYMWGTGTKWDIYEDYSASKGIICTDLKTDQNLILSELRKGYPVVVSVRRGIFTYGGHFIVLTGIDDEDNITMNDPMSIEHSSRTWKLSEFSDQIKNTWSFHI